MSNPSPRVDRDVVLEWATTAALAADDKQGRETVVLEVGAVLAITDFFVITSATNSRQVRTIAEEVEEKVKAGETEQITAPEKKKQKGAEVIDLMDALKKSLEPKKHTRRRRAA